MKRRPEPEVMDLPEEARAYAQADFADVNAAFVECLTELTVGIDSAHALDLGTGPADIAFRVASVRPDWRIVAVDASYAMLKLAQPVNQHNLHLVQADAKALPFKDRCFDVIFSNSILHHITDTGRFWLQVRRVATPGAFVFLRDLARPENESAARAVVEQYSGGESELLKEEFFRSLLAAYTPQEVRPQLASAGLVRLEVKMSSDRHLDIVGRI